MDPEMLRALRATPLNWDQEEGSSSFSEEVLEAFRESMRRNEPYLDIFERAVQSEWTQCPPVPPLSEGMERAQAENLVTGDIIHDFGGLLNAIQRIDRPPTDTVRMLMVDGTWREFRRTAVVTRVKAKEPSSETVRPNRFARIFADT